MNRHGGNTSCVQLTLRSGEELVLDAGTGIRTLGMRLLSHPHVNILLTHLHLDHIQGLMFFPPCFRANSTITIWGPASPEASLEDRIARYISAPLSPVLKSASCPATSPSATPRPPSGRSGRQRSAPRR
jgi:phosphoribosyl 1,2-cyclic phosphodiesterase